MKQLPESALNFRSLGGIRNKDGKKLREGVLYRAGDMGALRSTCKRRLQALGIRTFVDLRSDKERLSRPYVWDHSADFTLWNHPAQSSDASIRAMVRAAHTTHAQVYEAMKGLYRSLPISHANSYARIFSALASDRAPVLFACAAGKDRTGVGAALVLWALDVERDEIVKDYLKSNASQCALEAMVNAQFGWDTDSAAVKAVLGADRTYLDAMFEHIESQWGGIRAYLLELLKIDDDMLCSVRNRVLE